MAALPLKSAGAARTPVWRNVTILKWVAQLATVAAIVLLFVWLFGNFSDNQAEGSSPFSFRFLDEPAGFQVGEGYTLTPVSGSQALLVGIVNTFKVALIGIIAATLLGTIVGIARLSNNWLVARVSSVYIETMRNIPLLVQMVFWLALLTLLGKLRADTGPISGWFIASSKGVAFAFLLPGPAFLQWLPFLIVGIIVARYVKGRRRQLRDETGQETNEVSWALGALVVVGGIGFVAHPVVAPLRIVWSALESLFSNLALGLFQAAVALAIVAVAIAWIVRFVRSFRTPAGMGKLTDDDYYRIIFAALAAVAGVIAIFSLDFVAQTTLDAGRNLFARLESEYHAPAGAAVIDFSKPQLDIGGANGQFVTYGDGGVVFTPAFLAVFIGVTLYTAAFIGEAVRGGILAVPKGQTEAGLAAGHTRSQLLRLIVLPQAFRVIIPPVGNQYLNLAKNTSLGVAVGYLEIVGVGRIMASKVGSQASVAVIWMAFYMAMSLSISSLINWYNRRSQIVER